MLHASPAARAASTSPGRAPRGHFVEQSLHWWHSQTSGSATSRSFRPHWAQIISLRGKGFRPSDSSQTTEQVAHWKHFFRSSPPSARTRPKELPVRFYDDMASDILTTPHVRVKLPDDSRTP